MTQKKNIELGYSKNEENTLQTKEDVNSIIVNHSRRNFLHGVSTVVAGSVIASLAEKTRASGLDNPLALPKQDEIKPLPFNGRIDVHSHFVPERYRKEAIAAGHSKPDGMPGLPLWSVDRALKAMDRFGISTSILSISSPGVHFGNDAQAIALARAVNEEGAEAVALHPKRFGLFASLPLPNIEASLKEITYALDVLGADGITMESNHHGIYLGDARLDPILDELNKKKAILFIHPTSPDCPCCQNSGLVYPRPMMEFMFETSRVVTNMILNGTLDKYKNIKFIIPHGGAMMPILVDRITGLSPALGLTKPLDPEHVFKLLKGLHYDLAGFPIPRQLGALLQIADENRIMYGSDWPFTPDPLVLELSGKIDHTHLLTSAQKLKILRTNALSLFPRLAAQS